MSIARTARQVAGIVTAAALLAGGMGLVAPAMSAAAGFEPTLDYYACPPKAQPVGVKCARLTVPLLVEALAAGAAPPGADAALRSFLDGASPAEVIVAVRTAASRSGNPPKEIWGNARALGKALHCEKGPWYPGG